MDKEKGKMELQQKILATVSQKGVVKGKKSGKATITAKIGKKKYRYKVTVQATKKSTGYTPSGYTPPSNTNTSSNNSSNSSGSNQQNGSNTNSVTPAQLAANVEVKMGKINSGILMIVTNRNKVWLDSVNIGVSFCNSEGTLVFTDNITFSSLKPGGSDIVPLPMTSDVFTTIDTSKSKFSKTVKQHNLYTYRDNSSSVTCIANPREDAEIPYTIKNNANEYVTGTIAIYYYDSTGKVVDADCASYTLNSNESKTDSFYTKYDYDEFGNTVYPFSTYKIFVVNGTSMTVL